VDGTLKNDGCQIVVNVEGSVVAPSQ